MTGSEFSAHEYFVNEAYKGNYLLTEECINVINKHKRDLRVKILANVNFLDCRYYENTSCAKTMKLNN